MVNERGPVGGAGELTAGELAELWGKTSKQCRYGYLSTPSDVWWKAFAFNVNAALAAKAPPVTGQLTALVEQEIGDVFREADGHPRCEIVCKYVRRVLEEALAAKAPQGVPAITQAAIDFYDVMIDKGFQDWDSEDCCRFCDCRERGAHTADCPFAKFAIAVKEERNART